MAESCRRFAEMVAANPGVDLRLHTPAHQGRLLDGTSLWIGEADDVRYFTRSQLSGFQERIAGLYGCKQTICLTSGTTAGCLAAVLALARRHRSVWILRNCHKSIVNGLVLSGVMPRFIRPSMAVVTPEELEARFAAAGPEAPTAIVFTNPTFEGWGMEPARCFEVCRRYGLEIVVDESHGSHWAASPLLPQTALQFDVDLVLHSLHKYAGGFVQTALMHLPRSSRLDGREVGGALDLIETTTLSNLLLLNLERAVERLFEPNTAQRISELVTGLDDIRYRLLENGGPLRGWRPPGGSVSDPLKLFLSSVEVDSQRLASGFFEAGVDHEFFDPRGVLFIFSMINTSADLALFERACLKVAQRTVTAASPPSWVDYGMNEPEMVMSPREAHSSTRERIRVAEARGRVAAEMIASCPPGWPLLIPGERVGAWHCSVLGEGTLVDVVA